MLFFSINDIYRLCDETRQVLINSIPRFTAQDSVQEAAKALPEAATIKAVEGATTTTTAADTAIKAGAPVEMGMVETSPITTMEIVTTKIIRTTSITTTATTTAIAMAIGIIIITTTAIIMQS